MAPGKGFGIGDVQARSGQSATFQRGDQLCGIGVPAASDTDEISAMFYRGKEFPAENPCRFPGQGQGIDDHVRLRGQFWQLVRQAHVIDKVRSFTTGPARGDDPHAQRRCPSRNLGADTAEADHQHGFPADFNHGGRRIRRPLPDLFLLHMMKILQVPGQHHQHGHDVFRYGRSARVLRIGQDKIDFLRCRGQQAVIKTGPEMLQPA